MHNKTKEQEKKTEVTPLWGFLILGQSVGRSQMPSGKQQ